MLWLSYPALLVPAMKDLEQHPSGDHGLYGHHAHMPRVARLLMRNYQRIIAICSSGHRKSDTPEAICTTDRRTARGGWQDVDFGITGVCGDRLPERRAAAAAIQEQPRPEVGALG
jgi:hypothetical protein